MTCQTERQPHLRTACTTLTLTEKDRRWLPVAATLLYRLGGREHPQRGMARGETRGGYSYLDDRHANPLVHERAPTELSLPEDEHLGGGLDAPHRTAICPLPFSLYRQETPQPILQGTTHSRWRHIGLGHHHRRVRRHPRRLCRMERRCTPPHARIPVARQGGHR